MRGETSVSGMRDAVSEVRDESSVSVRREDPVSERRDCDIEISSDERDGVDFNSNDYSRAASTCCAA